MITIISLLFVSLALFAGDNKAKEQIIEGRAPAGIQELVTDIKSHDRMYQNEREHGEKTYCYKKNDNYIVYSKNLFGEGYILSKNIPENLVCVETTKEIISGNKLGIHIGMSKSRVEDLINIYGMSDSQIIWWQSIKEINAKPYTLQTYGEFRFHNNVLIYIEVFTTTTY
jgi:hypothetical protein